MKEKKIYTTHGDNGTSWIRGKDLSKNHKIFHLLGTIDELNANLIMDEVTGLTDLAINDNVYLMVMISEDKEAATFFKDRVKLLEAYIDRQDMVISGSFIRFTNPISIQLNIARTICRRAERLMAGISVCKAYKMYLNRLSDLLYVMAVVAEKGE